MGASTKKISTAPEGSDKLRGGIIDYLTSGQGLGRINAANPADPARVGIQQAGPVSVAPWSGGNMDRGMVRDVSLPGWESAAGGLNRGMVRDVTARGTQSVDQLGGANSAFFQNMMAQLAPAFDTQRALAAAAGKEAGGNLTGSGFANRLGSSLGRTLGDQQALLANYAVQGLGMEVNRQAGDADRFLRGDLANQGADQSFISNLLQGRGLDLQARGQDLNAMQGNQSADLGFLNSLLTSRGQDLSARGQDIGVATGNADREQGVYNNQAGLDQARNLAMYSQQFQGGQNDANRFLQLLMQQGQPFQDAIVQSGGIGQLLGPLAQGLGGYFGAKGQNPISGTAGMIGSAGSAIGNWISGLFGGGTQGAINKGNNTAAGVDWDAIGKIGQNVPSISPSVLSSPFSNTSGSASMTMPTLYGNDLTSNINGTTPQTAANRFGGGELLGSGMEMGPDGRPRLSSFASGENAIMNQILGSPNGLGSILSILLGGGMGGGGGLLGGILPQPKQQGIGGIIADSIGKGVGSKAGTLIGGALGSAIPIPGVGTVLGSILGNKVGGVIGKGVGKVGGFLKRLF